MDEPLAQLVPPEIAGPGLVELIGFAELVADTALSYLQEHGTASAPTLLEQIVAGAILVIPGTVAAAVETLDDGGRLQAPVMVGDQIARAVMDAQNTTGQGPCLDALRTSTQIIAANLASDPRWPLLAADADQLRIRSMICTPLTIGVRTIGVLSLMCRATEFADDDDTPTMATVFAAHAAIAMNNADRVRSAFTALDSRDVIGQAKGILMERFKVTPDVAFAMLVRTSSRTNLKLRDVAEQLCLTGVLLPDPPRAHRKDPVS